MATVNNNRFRANMANRIEKAKVKHELFYRKLTLEILSRVVLKSPVDTGRFRANWNIGNGSPDTHTDQLVDPNGTSTIQLGQYQLMGMKINGQTIYVTNSLPYAYRLEYEGWSQQAPAGMVRVTLAELGGVAREIANEVKRS
jgi:hypothetical protein